MTTLIVKDDSITSRQFLEYARTLPYIEVVEKIDQSDKTLKPSVAKALRKSANGEGLVECKDADDMFQKLGLR
jgi:hypothetical protein